MPSSTTPTPRLSVVIPCRNAANVIGTQLAALAGQPCPVPWEILLCDNGSTDATIAVASSWQDRLPLRIVDAAAAVGAAAVRNIGIAAARGEWIGFCDADDMVGDTWLTALCQALAGHAVVAGPCEAARLNSPRVQRSRRLDQQAGLQRSPTGPDLPHASSCNLGVHRAVLEQVGGFDATLRHLEDTDLCWRIQRSGHPLVFVPDLLVHVRLRTTLSGMFRQGRDYGAGQAGLDRRYGPEQPAAQPPARFPGPTGRTVRGAMRLLNHFVHHRSSVGEQVWQLGWHLGHRQRAARPDGSGISRARPTSLTAPDPQDGAPRAAH